MAVSAVASVSTSGVFETAMPASLAASMSILEKPTPTLAIIRTRRPSTCNIPAAIRSLTVGTRASWSRIAAASAAAGIGRSLGLKVAS